MKLPRFLTKAVKMPRFGVKRHEIAIRTILLVLTFYLLIYKQVNDLVVNNLFRHRNQVNSPFILDKKIFFHRVL